MEKFRGRSIYGKLMTIDWARASARDPSTKSTDETIGQFCLFVGNLSPDVTDEQLVTAFSEFGSCTSAKCARDPVTYKTQGFAFVSFRERDDAVAAMDAMNGQLLNNRALRVDWAKGRTGGGKTDNPTSAEQKKDALTFDAVLSQTSVNNVTAYISGLDPKTTEDKIRESFAPYGGIREIRIPESAKTPTAETMYAFVRYVDHTSAAKAIFECQPGVEIDGRTIQVHWGREVVRRAAPQIARPPVAHPNPYFHGGFPHPQQQYPTPFPQYPSRPVYPSQPYARGAPPGPTHHPHTAAQHRYRPY